MLKLFGSKLAETINLRCSVMLKSSVRNQQEQRKLIPHVMEKKTFFCFVFFIKLPISNIYIYIP
jgi:hypothetical protein